MASTIEICNLALLRLGHAREISSLDEGSAESDFCKAFYDHCRKTVLRAHPWNFAVTTAELALLTDESDEYDYVYQLPTGCLRALEIVNIYSDDKLEFEIRGRKLYTDEEHAVLKYTSDEDDPNTFDQEFIDALSYLLAAELAGPLRQDLRAQDYMTRVYRVRVAEAAATDSNEGKPEPVTSYLDARA